MTEIKAVKVYELEESIIASGLAMKTEPYNYNLESSLNLDKHINRCKRLVKASKDTDVHCHDNFLTGIRVSFDIKYPQYLSPEMQRYHFFDIVTSMSKMHRLSKMELKRCCTKYTPPEIIRVAQLHIDAYNSILADESITTYKYWTIDKNIDKCVRVEGRENVLYAAFMVMLNAIPLGLELWMRVSTNYKQLQTIYYQRRHHRLKEDWGAVIKMIEELPYFTELILGENSSDILNNTSTGHQSV